MPERQNHSTAVLLLVASILNCVFTGCYSKVVPPEPSLAAQPDSAEYSDAKNAKTPGYMEVEVFYGTDRQLITRGGRPNADLYPSKFRWAGGLVLLALLLGWWRSKWSPIVRMVAVVPALLGALFFFIWGSWLYFVPPRHPKPDVTYGTERNEDGSIDYGRCLISIPKDHRIGHLEAPSILRFEVNEDPNKHVVLLKLQRTSWDAFIASINPRLEFAVAIKTGQRVNKESGPELFVFVHGYDVSFDNAARRTAQLAYDLDFQGVPVFYSWPSKANEAEYTRDENNVQWAAPHLAKFIDNLAEDTYSSTIHLIAHSMGTRCLTEALRQLKGSPKGIPSKVREVVLAAPDIDADTFREYAPGLLQRLKRVTLYASSGDKALSASKLVHGYPRAGESGDHLVVIPPMETIDASKVATDFIGHSYYGDKDSVLADLFYLFREGMPASKRFGMMPMKKGKFEYWLFSPH
jgi:esterase/lipase superfamily enzyme